MLNHGLTGSALLIFYKLSQLNCFKLYFGHHSHNSIDLLQSDALCQCCPTQSLLMSALVSQKAAAYKCPARGACGQSSWWCSRARGATAGRRERRAEVLRKAHAKPFLLHASHQGPWVMLSHLETCTGLIWPKLALPRGSYHRPICHSNGHVCNPSPEQLLLYYPQPIG